MATSNTYTPNAPANPYPGVGSAVGNREDLTSILTILAPEETPIVSLCPKSKSKSTFNEWTVDALDTPSTVGILEGADVSSYDDKFSGRARLGNYVQKFRKTYKVSDLQEAVDSVGPANIAQAKAKALRELKRNVEAAFASDNDRTIEDGATIPYRLRGLGDWLDSAGPADVPAAYRTPAASILTAAPTEATLNDQISSIFTETGETNSLTLIAGVALRKAVSNFTRTEGTVTRTPYTVTQSAESKKVTLSVTLFDSDFGMIKMVNGNPACMPNANRGYLVNPARLGCATLIALRTVALEDQGGGPRGYAEWTGTLQMKHPKAHGKIAY